MLAPIGQGAFSPLITVSVSALEEHPRLLNLHMSLYFFIVIMSSGGYHSLSLDRFSLRCPPFLLGALYRLSVQGLVCLPDSLGVDRVAPY